MVKGIVIFIIGVFFLAIVKLTTPPMVVFKTPSGEVCGCVSEDGHHQCEVLEEYETVWVRTCKE